MSEPITWRSVSAPNFGASAALLNSGGETLNQGITSLAAVAKGYADEQKGIAVSNAVADLSNTTNDADRMAAFTAHSANLKDHGIDLKDLIAANQAQHTTLNSDATLKSNLAMHDSTIKMNDSSIQNDAIKRIGYGFENQTAEGKLKNLVLEQQDAHKSNEQKLLESAANITASNASADASGASAEHSRAGTKALGDVALEKERGRNSALAYDKLASDPAMLSLDPVTRKPVLDQNKVHDAWVANGGNPLDLILGRETHKSMLETDKTEKADALEETRKHEGNLITLRQTAADDSKAREASLASDIATLDTDWNLFGDTELAKGTATLTAMYAKTYVDSKGNTVKVPTSLINAAKESAASNGDLYGDGKLAAFNNTIDNWITEQQQGKGKDKPNADGKSRARNPMAGINN
jgi:hypothetical protein